MENANKKNKELNLKRNQEREVNLENSFVKKEEEVKREENKW